MKKRFLFLSVLFSAVAALGDGRLDIAVFAYEIGTDPVRVQSACSFSGDELA